MNLLNTRHRRTLFTFIVDGGWRESRLPSLAGVLLCLVRVGVLRVSWAVRYLDKPQWRAVPINQSSEGVKGYKMFCGRLCTRLKSGKLGGTL